MPLGGYIRIVGMIPPAEEGESKRATRMRSFIAEVRGAALDDVLPTDGNRVFYAKPWWQRVIVMFAGPFHNLVLAVVFFALALSAIGTTVDSTRIQEVPACVLPATASTGRHLHHPRRRQGQGLHAGTAGCALPEASPAAKAGLLPGRHHRRGRRQAARPHRAEQLDRPVDGHPRQRRPPPRAHRRAARPAPRASRSRRSRTPSTRTGNSGTTTTAGLPRRRAAHAFARQPVSALPGSFGSVVSQSLRPAGADPRADPAAVPGHLPRGESATRTGPIGVVGVGRLSGEAFATNGVPGMEKLSFFLSLLASINLVLFLFNLLPIYPLDGGHVAGALYERPARASPGCAAGRTPARSTSPGSCRSPTWSPAVPGVLRRCSSSPTSSTRSTCG